MRESEDRGSVGDAAKDAAGKLKQDAEQALGEIKSRGIMGFFSFERLYFPVVARYLFIILFALIVIGVILGVIGGLVGMVSVGIMWGLSSIIGSLIMGAIFIIGLRIWFEMFVVGFKINENLEKIRGKMD